MMSLKDHPAARYPLQRALEDDLGCWAVAHVKSRHEKALARDLARAEIPYYLPMVEKRTRRRDDGKVRKSVIPLFPGYLALGLPREHWDRAYRTHRVVNLMPVEDQRGFVQELAQIQRTIDSRVKLSLAPAFSAGQLVRVKRGPLMGLEGEVASVKGQTIFVIWVQVFQRAVQVEMDELDLEPM
jgi:transcription antitermination factor NusG